MKLLFLLNIMFRNHLLTHLDEKIMKSYCVIQKRISHCRDGNVAIKACPAPSAKLVIPADTGPLRIFVVLVPHILRVLKYRSPVFGAYAAGETETPDRVVCSGGFITFHNIC